MAHQQPVSDATSSESQDLPYFFVHHSAQDTAWAEWITWVLEAEGYEVRMEGRDIRPGQNRLSERNRLLVHCRHTIAVLSATYLADTANSQQVLSAALHQNAKGKDRALIPVRIDECEAGALLGPMVPIDLVGLEERVAVQAVLNGIGAAVTSAPSFPGRPSVPRAAVASSAARFPASTPSVWELRGHRPDPNFIGREDLLTDLHQRLKNGGATALVQAITGLGGIGKTRAAIEYAYRYARVYDLVWWIRAERPETLLSDYAGLATALSLPFMTQQEMTIAAVHQELRRRKNWLLIFDNADDPSAIFNLIPASHSGNAVITTRRREWPNTDNLPIEVLDAPAAREYLRRRAGVVDDRVADSLANALGLLPLALAQAAAVIADGMGAAEYLGLLESRAPELFRHGRPTDSETTVVNTWRISIEQLAAHPAAVALQQLSAFFAPDALPLTILQPTNGLPDELVRVLTDPISRVAATRELAQYSLAQPAGGELSTHRLVQLIVRTELANQEGVWAGYALTVALNTFPTEPQEPARWVVAEQFLPHAIVAAAHALRIGVEPAGSSVLLERCSRYLLARGRIDEAADLAKQAIAVAGTIGTEHPAVLAALHSHGEALKAQGHLHDAWTVLEGVYKRRIGVLGQDDPRTLSTARALISTRYALGDLMGSRALDEHTLPLHSDALGDDHPDSITALAYHATLLRSEGRYRDAYAIEERIINRRQALLGADHPDTLTAISNLANTLDSLGESRQARELHEQVLNRRRVLPGADHPNTLTAMSNLASTLDSLGESRQARELQVQMLNRYRDLLGADHPDTLTAMNNLASTLDNLGELRQARELHEQVLNRHRDLLGADHPNTLRAMNNLANTLDNLGESRQARELHEHVLNRHRDLLGVDHPDTLTTMSNLASTLHSLGELRQARELQEQVLNRRQDLLGVDHPDTLTAMSNLASTLDSLGELRQARELQGHVLNRHRDLLGADHPRTLNVISNLASVLTSSGDLSGARTLLGEGLNPARVSSANGTRLRADWRGTLTASRRCVATLRPRGPLPSGTLHGYAPHPRTSLHSLRELSSGS